MIKVDIYNEYNNGLVMLLLDIILIIIIIILTIIIIVFIINNNSCHNRFGPNLVNDFMFECKVARGFSHCFNAESGSMRSAIAYCGF